jgi:F-type H+-transporting ATPase subunit b
MKLLSATAAFCLLGGVLAGASPAHAEGEHAAAAAAPSVQRDSDPAGRAAAPEAAPEHEAEEHAPSFDDVNWMYGFLGEKAGVEPSILWRPKGMPVPFGALALDAAILYWLLFKYGKKPIGDALKARKFRITKGMEDAAKMKAEAEASLAKYQKKLDEIDDEVARIKREMKEAGDAESARILSDAKERRSRMEKDARTLVEQELKAAREGLVRATVRAAVKSAEVTLLEKIGDADQQRLGDEFLASIKGSGAALRGRV